MVKKILVVMKKIILLLVLLMLSCSQKTEEDQILARTADQQISLAAFSRSYLQEFIYSSIQSKDSPQSRKEHIQSMLLRHELAQRATDAGLDTLAGFRLAMKAESTAVIIHALYEKEIAAELPEISDQEVQIAFSRMNRELHVRHLVAKTKAEIDELYRRLQAGHTFTELARTCFHDSLLAHNGGDLGFIKWGDMDLEFENMAYSLQIGQTSAPFESKFGWHILKLENIVLNPIVREDEYQAYKEIIRNKLRNRILTHKADFRIKELITSKEIMMNVPLIRLLEKEWRRLQTNQIALNINPELFSRPLSNMLDQYGTQTVASYKGGVWLVNDFARYRFTLPRGTLEDGFYGAVAMALRNYFLLQIAEEKKIDRIKSVRNRIQEKRDHLLANVYVNTLADTVTFYQPDRRAYYEEHRDRFGHDRNMQVLEILLPSQPQAIALIKKLLASGKDEKLFRRLAKQHTIRPGLKAKEGYLGTIGKEAYGPIGKACFTMGKGDIMGPIKTEQGYSIVMLLDGTEVAKPFAQVEPEIEKEMQQQKRKIVYDKLRQDFLSGREIVFDEGLLINGIYMSGQNKAAAEWSK